MTVQVATHRRPRHRSLGGNTARTAATLALAGAATATAFEGVGHAEPQLTPAQVRTRVDTLYREAESATEKYNGAKEKADTAQRRLNSLYDETAREQARLNTARDALGTYAAAQYRDGTIAPTWQLALSSDPDRYLDGAALAERVGDQQAGAVTRVRTQLREIERLRGAARVELKSLRGRQAEAKRQKKTVTTKLTEARRLLDRLTPREREKATGTAPAHAGRAAVTATRPVRAHTPAGGTAGNRAAKATGAPAVASNSRAAAAVAYAYRKLGSPYVWGATGPNAFDCSGLIQAAYRSAGVSLPRTTYAQINAGRRVSRSQLRPGDLVFFYSGVSHVGLYIGNGRMIHAPNPSAPVRVAPISQMPFAGATRVV